jgi:hypothetical protein
MLLPEQFAFSMEKTSFPSHLQSATVKHMENEKFNEFFKETLKPQLEELEKERKRIHRKRIRNIILGTIVGIIFAVVAVLFGGMEVAPLVLISCVGFSAQYPRTRDFQKKFQQEIIKSIFQHYHIPLEIQKQDFPKEKIISSGFFNIGEDLIEPEKYFSGKKENIVFDFCEMGIKVRQKKAGFFANKPMPQKSNTSVKYMVKGLFLCARMPHSRKAGVWVYPRNTVLGVNPGINKKVELESLDFNKIFDVRGDQLQARMILTPLAMEQLLQLQTYLTKNKKLPKHLTTPFVSFVDDRFSLFVSSLNLSFTASIRKSLLDEETIEKYFEKTKTIFHILDILNLTKEQW